MRPVCLSIDQSTCIVLSFTSLPPNRKHYSITCVVGGELSAFCGGKFRLAVASERGELGGESSGFHLRMS